MSDILIVDDEEKMRHLVSIMLERQGYEVEQAGDGLEALEKLMAGSFKLVISDIKMPRMDGKLFLKRIKEEDLSVPVVIITAFATISSAVELMRAGACDYLTKPFDEDRLILTVIRALKLSTVMQSNQALKTELDRVKVKDQFVFHSKKMKNIVALADKVAGTNSAVMLTGQSGTGKEVLSRYIHDRSCRAEDSFVPVNCAAISSNLVESELFGYEKGAFTGAVRRCKGKFEFASGGTLFLDEIGDLPLDSQGKFLRALQEKKIQRVGGHEEVSVNVRVICATNKKLNEEVEAGRFRQDLFYRINVFPIELPPLSHRQDDILPLANYFLQKFNTGKKEYKLTPAADDMLISYDWPGNVRELANVMERAIILAPDSGLISHETLAFLKYCTMPGNGATTKKFELPAQGVHLDEVEISLAKQALELTSNNQTRAAELLGLTRARFRVLLKNMEN